MAELLGLPYSPWTEKARWALDARRITYTFRRYQPLIGEPGLRWKMSKWRGNVSVPVFTPDDGEVIGDSANIARWASEHGSGPTLFPAGTGDAMIKLIDLSERGLAAGRARSLLLLVDSPDGVREMVPKAMRWMPGSNAIARYGIRRTVRKYQGTNVLERALDEQAAALDEIRAALGKVTGQPKTLLGELSFADIAVSQVLGFVEPPPFGLRIAPATRATFGDPVLREKYADLVSWRDALYEKYRPRVQ
ncbi:MAG TPA: glutathione S-transferase N-terminal domain-containing protein [Kofleriaceae bacterium]